VHACMKGGRSVRRRGRIHRVGSTVGHSVLWLQKFRAMSPFACIGRRENPAYRAGAKSMERVSPTMSQARRVASITIAAAADIARRRSSEFGATWFMSDLLSSKAL
jgi:hypothetical protein